AREVVGYEPSGMKVKAYTGDELPNVAADPVVQYMNPQALEKAIAKIKKEMEAAAKELDFYEAARLRDEMYKLQGMLKEKVR
ncbi:MAG: UvrB/UvrC motif-containing protein, partial [Bacteroidales bacterium]